MTDRTAWLAAEKKSRYYSLLYHEMAERQRAEEQLREYNRLLKALTHAQLQFVSSVPLDQVFTDLLRELLLLLPCEYGRIDTTVYDGRSPLLKPTIQTAESVAVLYPEDVDALGAIARECLDACRPVYSELTLAEKDSAPGRDASPPVSERLRNGLGLPFTTGDHVVGVLALANRPGPFDETQTALLQPVLSTCAQLIAAEQSDRKRREAEASLAQERKSLAERVAERTRELTFLNAELARALRAKDEFLATMNHELRTPLNGVLLMAEALQREVYGPINARQRELLTNVGDSGRHLLAVINDILDVAKTESGKMELDIAPCSVDSVCRSAVQLVAELAYKKDLSLDLKLDPTVDEIQADQQRLKQILVNLLSNAVKFTPDGGTLGLSVKGSTADNVVRFVVWDTGIGIPPDDMPKLFKPFVQLRNGRVSQEGGTGLGLVLVERMADMHGGSVTVQSDVDKGSCFTIALPWRQTQTPGDHRYFEDASGKSLSLGGVETRPVETDPPLYRNITHRSSHHAMQSTAGNDKPLHYANGLESPHPNGDRPLILIADDNKTITYLLVGYLQSQGYRVLTAHNGSQTIRLTKEHRPHLVLMDLQMPEIDGLEATRRIKSDATLANTPIVALTALVMPGIRERCLAAGMQDFLSKPVSRKDLDHVLQTMAWENHEEQSYAVGG